MQRGTTTRRLRAAGALVAAAATVSCGSGIHGPQNWLFVQEDVDQQVNQEELTLTLREGTLKLQPYSVNDNAFDGEPVIITLRRHEHHDHGGALGPVFEIDVPAPDTLVKAPTLSIATSAEVAQDPLSVLGYVHPTTQRFEQWTPDMTGLPRGEGVVSGLVQLEDFTNPGGMKDKATGSAKLAIVRLCPNGLADCRSGQECSSGCCQECATGGPCKP